MKKFNLYVEKELVATASDTSDLYVIITEYRKLDPKKAWDFKIKQIKENDTNEHIER